MSNSNEVNTNNELKEIKEWEELEVDRDILRGIYAYGFERPSPIQKRAIIPMIERRDIIAQAQSGTGKTGAFVIGTLQIVSINVPTTQSIILAPTRELAHQIIGVLGGMSTMVKGIKTHLLIGGTSTEQDIKILKEDTPHVVVGCPGRVHDMMRRKHINAKTIKLIILDEADEMLSSGFKEQVYNIFQYLPNDVQVGLFSATMPQELGNLTEKFMRNPIKILVKTEQLTLEGISQYYVGLEDDGQKYSTLKDLYGSISMNQCIIFCNSVRRVGDLHEAMKEDGYPVCCIHSGMEKEERTDSYKEFRLGKCRVLISSNVTARGIDIQQVSTVINFDIPKCIYTYLHRVGRSGRWGRSGVGISFVTRRDYKKVKEIEAYYSTRLEELPSSFVQS